MNIKVRDALGLVEGIDVKIGVTENYLMSSTLIPQGRPPEEVAGYTEGLSKALGMLNALYTEKFSIMNAVNAKLAEAVLEMGGVEKTYNMLALDLEKVIARLDFLKNYLFVTNKEGISFAEKENYVSAIAPADLLNDFYSMVNHKCSLVKQINDVCEVVEIEVKQPETPPIEEATAPTPVEDTEQNGDEESQEG